MPENSLRDRRVPSECSQTLCCKRCNAFSRLRELSSRHWSIPSGKRARRLGRSRAPVHQCDTHRRADRAALYGAHGGRFSDHSFGWPWRSYRTARNAYRVSTVQTRRSPFYAVRSTPLFDRLARGAHIVRWRVRLPNGGGGPPAVAVPWAVRARLKSAVINNVFRWYWGDWDGTHREIRC